MHEAVEALRLLVNDKRSGVESRLEGFGEDGLMSEAAGEARMRPN